MINTTRMLHWNKKKFNWQQLKEFGSFLFDKNKGVMGINNRKELSAFYAKDFHPSNDDSSALLAEWKHKLGYE